MHVLEILCARQEKRAGAHDLVHVVEFQPNPIEFLISIESAAPLQFGRPFSQQNLCQKKKTKKKLLSFVCVKLFFRISY